MRRIYIERIKQGLLPGLAIVICLLAGIGTAWAQSGNVILPMRETTLKQAMDELQRQTSYKVAVNWEDLDAGRRVFFPSQELSVQGLLRAGLSGTGFGWEVAGSQIIVVRKATDDGRGAHSAMIQRGSFPGEAMKFVPDRWSTTQKPFGDMFNVRKSYWNPDGCGDDSLGMAVINYRINSATVEKDYMDNARTLEIIHKALTDKEVLAGLDYIIVTSGSSPDGNSAANESLAEKRSMAMKSYLMWKYPYLDRDIIYTFSIGEDWSGLRDMVADDAAIPHRDEVLAVLDGPADSDGKRAALRGIDGGEAYGYIAANMFPRLRGASAATLHFKEMQVREIVVEKHIVDTVTVEKTVEIEKVRIVVQEPETEPCPLFAVKTNLLFDAASALNVGLEIPIGSRWSVDGEWVFPWWLYDKRQYALQIGNGNLGVKYWLGNRTGRRQLTGWFAQVYGGGGYYDLELKTRGWQGEFWHVGIGGGYAHTVSQNGNWRMEYSLGVGYMSTCYREYTPRKDADGRWHLIRSGEGSLDWIGPTQARVSLVWMINHGYRRKGGGGR